MQLTEDEELKDKRKISEQTINCEEKWQLNVLITALEDDF